MSEEVFLQILNWTGQEIKDSRIGWGWGKSWNGLKRLEVDIFALILSLAKYHNDLERAENFDSSVDDMVTLFPEDCKWEYIIIIYLLLLDFRLKIHSLLK